MKISSIAMQKKRAVALRRWNSSFAIKYGLF